MGCRGRTIDIVLNEYDVCILVHRHLQAEDHVGGWGGGHTAVAQVHLSRGECADDVPECGRFATRGHSVRGGCWPLVPVTGLADRWSTLLTEQAGPDKNL